MLVFLLRQHRKERLAVDVPINLHSRRFEQGRHDIDIVNLGGCDSVELIVTGHFDDERHPDQGLVEPLRFAGKPELSTETPLIRREDNDGVVIDPGLLQGLDETANRLVDEGDLSGHHGQQFAAILLGHRVKSGALGLDIVCEGMLVPIDLIHPGKADLVQLLLVHAEVGLADNIGPVGCRECHVEEEGPVLVFLHERDRIIGDACCHALLLGKRFGKIDQPFQKLMPQTRLGAACAEEVAHRFVIGVKASEFLLLFAPRGVFRKEIEPLFLIIFLKGMVLTGEPDRVARIFERLDEGVLARGDFTLGRIIKTLVLGGVFSSEETCAAGAAKHRHGEGILKLCPFLGQRIDMGRLDHRIAAATKRIPALVVGHDNDDVGPVGSRPFGGVECCKRREQQGGKCERTLHLRRFTSW